MAGIIRVTPAKLMAAASSFQSTGNTIRSLTSQMTQIVNGLSGNTWTGEASEAYKQRFRGLESDIARMLRMIDEHVTDLNQMAREYETAESTSTQQANALKEDVIN